MTSFYISKNAALSVRAMTLVVEGMGSIPLRSIDITMGIDNACVCMAKPVVGRDPISRKNADPDFLEKLDPSMKCGVYMSFGTGKSLLFTGRPTGTDLSMGTNPYSSSMATSIMIQHIAQADLSSCSIGQRSYYKDLDGSIRPFIMDGAADGYLIEQRFQNDTLAKARIAVYLKELCTELARWYMNGGDQIQPSALLKAVPCVIRDSVLKAVNVSGNKGESVSESFSKAVLTTFEGAVASKASLFSILSTLASFAMLTLIPTTDSYVISPRLDVSRWTKADGVSIPRAWLTSITSTSTSRRFPIDAVCINRKWGSNYLRSDSGTVGGTGLSDWGTKYMYPEEGADTGVLIVDPPPILAGVLDNSCVISDKGTPPKTIDEGGRGGSANSAGGSVDEPDPNAETLLSKAAARLMWSKLAFAHHSANLELLPHWVFGKDFVDEIPKPYDGNSPWSLIGRNVFFKLPYSTDGSSYARNVPYVGYVKGMTLRASVDGPVLSVTANVANVRTAVEDEKFALPSEANPLYENTDDEPV